ncbi:major surface protease [Trypanosoma grayi]|uniref:major surface protease n=1 Tax=Trypanosoma grayi TaxID=71804 RepID=UPI0004F47398|nr:major surface protease [Trypanosoma grayi]KEG06574.1 major surface protease [Trypanosoma grayi]
MLSTRQMGLHLLHVVLLQCTCVCLAAVGHSCNFDQVMRSSGPPAVVREVAQRRQGAWQAYTAAAPGWEPIRIKVFTEDLKNELRYCTAEGQERPNFVGRNVTCNASDILTADKKALLIDQLLPEAIKLHSDRLLVVPENVIVVRRFVVSACVYFTIPSDHRDPGVSGADMVLYAAAGPTVGENAAWSLFCSTLTSGRPSVGVINFGPQHIAANRVVIRAAAHEIAHALGFSAYLFAEQGMISRVEGLRGKTTAFVVSSKKTLQATRKHFNCSTAPGMELEDEGDEGTALSHWKRRNAKDELMAGVASVGFYSALTMSAFEDTGLYKANWGMEELMSWGNNTGCSFIRDKCMTNNITDYPDMFCNGSSGVPRCTSDRLYLGFCDIVVYNEALKPQYQYFANASFGGSAVQMTDYCPVITPAKDAGCTNNLNTLPGSRVGPTSRCLKGESLSIERNAIGDVCVEVACNSSDTLQVRYHGDDTWHHCPEGSSVTPGAPFTDGRIICPRYSDVCPTLACPAGGGACSSGNDASEGAPGGDGDNASFHKNQSSQGSDGALSAFIPVPLLVFVLGICSMLFTSG